jgi:hypothetical protein
LQVEVAVASTTLAVLVLVVIAVQSQVKTLAVVQVLNHLLLQNQKLAIQSLSVLEATAQQVQT